MAYTTINKSTDYFNTVLYTGNGSNNHTITGVGFNTDLAWIKNRGGDDHRLFDKVRGVNKFVKSNSTAAETTDAIFTTNSDGYVVTNAGEVNANNGNFVGWNWKANGAGSANTDGDVTSTVSVNSTAGFSIVKWTNSGNAGWIGHGLGTTPHWILIKNMGSGSNITAWVNYHHKIDASAPEDYTIYLNNTDARSNNAVFNDTPPTSTKFRFDSGDTTDYIAYCFAEKTGYSKFGSYVGNGNADGNFVYLGFKPAFVIAKNSTSSGYSWELFDNKRNTTDGVGNVIQKRLFPDSSAVEGGSSSTNYIDFLSNGFKIRRAGDSNENGSTYIYMAFAEAPLVGSNNVPCTAR